MLSKSKRFTHPIYSAILACFVSTEHSEASYGQAEGIYEDAILKSPLVEKMHVEGLRRRQEESNLLKILMSNIANNDVYDPEKLRELVIAGLKDDLALFEGLNAKIKAHQGASFPIKFNKMTVITNFALALAQDEKLYYTIVSGKLPEAYSIEAPKLNYFPDETNIFSVGKRGNALKSLLLKIWMIQNGKTSLKDLDSLFDHGCLDRSPFLHITELPHDLDVTEFQKSAHFFSDAHTAKALITINNGYAFGGHRDEKRYPDGKQNGPHDCSSLVALWTGAKTSFSTSHQALRYQEVVGFQFSACQEGLMEKWEAYKVKAQTDPDVAPYMPELRRVLQPVQTTADPQKLKPGLVHAERTYRGLAAEPTKALTGGGGHTSIYLGTVGSAAETKALTIGTNRDLEGSGKEGTYCVETRPLYGGIDKELLVMFFEVTK